jgi:hypothetical protein
LNFLNFEFKHFLQEQETWILLHLIFEDLTIELDQNFLNLKKEERWRLSHLQLVEKLKNMDPNFRRQMVKRFN